MPQIELTTLAEIIAFACLIAFWLIVWIPGILPTVSVALLAWSRSRT